MKKLFTLIFAFAVAITLLTSVAKAAVTSWDYAGGILQPLQSQWAAQIKGAYSTATSTTASTFPYASTTALSVSSLSSGNCLQASTGGLLTTTGSPCGAGSVTSVTGTYPVISSGGATPAISLAFGTTTSNTWAGTQIFTNPPVLGSLSGLIYGNSGVLSATATTSVTCAGSVSCSTFDVIGASPITITGSGGSGSVATSTVEAAGQVPFFTSTAGTPATIGGSNNLFWDNSNVRLGLGTSTPDKFLQLYKSVNGDTELEIENINTGTSARTLLRFSNDTSSASLAYNASTHGTQPRNFIISNNDTAGDIGFIFNGSQGVTFKQDGNVGIGTTSPSARLAITGAGAVGRAFVVANSSDLERLTVLENGNVGIGMTPSLARLEIKSPGAASESFRLTEAGSTQRVAQLFEESDSAGVFRLFNGADTASIVLDGNGNSYLNGGNVGIGTTTPYAKLSVVGQTVSEYFSATSTTLASTFPYASTTAISATTASTTDLYISSVGTAAGTFLAADATGKVIATTTPSGGSAPSLDYASTTASSLYRQYSLTAGDKLMLWTTSTLGITGDCSGIGNLNSRLLFKQSGYAATTTIDDAGSSSGNDAGCSFSFQYLHTATTTETVTVQVLSNGINFNSIMSQLFDI